MRSILIPALACVLIGPDIAAAADEKLDMCDFKPVMDEDFSSLLVSSRALDGARWIAHTPWNGDFGDALFDDPGPNGPFAVQGGELLITAHRDAKGRWHSGLLAAADGTGAGTGVQNGYFEARMKMPVGPGTWPAFWLSSQRPASDTSPGVEIDVIEYYGQFDASFSSAVHVWYNGKDKGKSRQTSHKQPVDPGSLATEFHNYGARVAPDGITFYFDGKPVWREATPPELNRPLFPLVNLALGSGFPIDHTPNPSVLAVKYIHVFEFDAAGRKSRCPG